MMQRCRIPIVVALLLCVAAVSVSSVDAATVKKRNIGDLIALGDVIVFGTVSEVRDGFDANHVPYTEVTVTVRSAAKGDVGATYTFRQFGLVEPRDLGNGLTYVGTTPDGWATYRKGEDVALFLYKAAAWTGLRTTVGLFQGKFTSVDGQVSNIIDNEGLFENVQINKKMLNDKELSMISMERGKVSLDVFESFVHKAVAEDWFRAQGEQR